MTAIGDNSQGDVDMAEVHRTHARMRSRGDLPFHDRWPASLQVSRYLR